MGVRLPYPFSVATRIEASRRTASTPMTASSPSIVTPRTPYAVRPIGRTSVSLKRIALPSFFERMISCVPSVRTASISVSSPSTPIATMPPRRGLE